MVGFRLDDNFTTDDDIAIPCLITEDIFHYAVHEGIAFSVSSIATSGDRHICFKTPDNDTYLHMLWVFSVENNTTFSVHEGVTPAAVTSDKVVYNKNRAAVYEGGNSTVTAGNSATVGSVQVDNAWSGGTEIYSEFASRRGGTNVAEGELVLERNTWYGFKLADIGTGDLGMTLTWFEVPRVASVR